MNQYGLKRFFCDDSYQKDKYNLGIIGATGVVGNEIISILNTDKNIHYDDLKLFASESSVGKNVVVRDKTYVIKKVDPESFIDLDYVILAVSSELAFQYVQWRDQSKSKCIFIDNSSAFRMHKEIPLIIPEINFDSYNNQNIIANPNCSTIIMLMALAPLDKRFNIKQIDIATYQSASGGGRSAMEELVNQTSAYVNNEEMPMDIFGRQYLFNAFSHNSPIDMASLYNGEEIKMIKETQKILGKSQPQKNQALSTMCCFFSGPRATFH